VKRQKGRGTKGQKGRGVKRCKVRGNGGRRGEETEGRSVGMG